MRILTIAAAAFAVTASLISAGCTQRQDPDQVRRETAHATSVMKENVKAVAEGVREGLKSDKSVDLNSASRTDLEDLPGITRERADRIIAGRPFGSTDELVSRHILSDAEYDQVKDKVRVGKPSPAIR